MIFYLNSIEALIFILTLNSCFSHSTESGRHSGHTHHQIKKEGGAKNVLRDKEYLRDYEHIKEDVQELYNKDFADKLDTTEMEIFYFQLHDLNDDKQLDGLELLAAINHVTDRDSNIPPEVLEKSPDIRYARQQWWNEKFEEDAPFIDEILKEEDLDQDGFLDFFEFAVGRQKDKEMGKL